MHVRIRNPTDRERALHIYCLFEQGARSNYMVLRIIFMEISQQVDRSVGSLYLIDKNQCLSFFLQAAQEKEFINDSVQSPLFVEYSTVFIPVEVEVDILRIVLGKLQYGSR